MRIELVSGDIVRRKADLLALGLFEGAKKTSGASATIDTALGGAVSAAIADGDFKGELGETLLMRPGKGIASPRLLLVGLGRKDRFTADHVRQAMLPILRAAKKCKAKTVATLLNGAGEGGVDPASCARFTALGAVLSAYEYDLYKPEKAHRVERLVVVASDAKTVSAASAALEKGVLLGESINWGRDLVAAPPADMRPDDLARAAKTLAGGKVSVTVHGRKELEKMKAGGILAVGRGSEIPPRLIVAEYRGGKKGAPWIALVGKGVTFDTGGISLKKPDGMDKMKYDMAGAAAMLSTLRAAAALAIPLNVVAIVPAVENMPSGTAYRPGDVLRAMSGKTIEVLSTDAEGRLILADALTYARGQYAPAEMIDAATLTGACVVALGSVSMGLMGNDAGLVEKLKDASAASGEKAWELPLHEEYFEQIKSDIGEIKNTGGPEAGTITAGCFLKEFAGDTPWAHFDIAGVAWREKDRMGYAPGPTCAPVRLLVEHLERSAARR
ncbi:MAG TPA: leucyl aminopeptidase [Candidatus Deferrimicrobiaceae bacterium]|jgi:leucyl aminopeptidase